MAAVPRAFLISSTLTSSVSTRVLSAWRSSCTASVARVGAISVSSQSSSRVSSRSRSVAGLKITRRMVSRIEQPTPKREV